MGARSEVGLWMWRKRRDAAHGHGMAMRVRGNPVMVVVGHAVSHDGSARLLQWMLRPVSLLLRLRLAGRLLHRTVPAELKLDFL